MSDKYFVDTNVLMYAHDHRSGVVSTQVLEELSVNLREKAGRALDTEAISLQFLCGTRRFSSSVKFCTRTR